MNSLPTSIHPLSESVEMYLKTAFELGAGGGVVPISALADRLGISPVSATEMVHRLEAEGLVEHTPYRGVCLSPHGLERARQVLRRHRLWEDFLYTELNLGWVEVHDMACSLEHAVDETVTEALAEWLDHPSTCPHGNPIPGEAGVLAQSGLEMTELAEGETAVVIRVRPERTDVLAYLDARQLRPGTAFTLQTRESLDGTLVLAVDGRTAIVGQSVASHVIVLPAHGMESPPA
jgi:DtxR family Mn-dependent transcriptional regulator